MTKRLVPWSCFYWCAKQNMRVNREICEIKYLTYFAPIKIYAQTFRMSNLREFIVFSLDDSACKVYDTPECCD